ncbi:hypothetical protein B0H19DRAFT_1243492 [Mycena capillaripes]|nr:hypothetical protein B0H19DRAFT_1243492 [Mycena capillaripes]
MEKIPVNLPIELEREIFEFTAWHYPETIMTLILVARRVCIWIEPQLYHVVLSSGSAQQLLDMMQSKPSDFLKEHVHHLALSSVIPRSDVTRILSTCTNVRDLAVWTGDTYPELLSDMRNLTNLQHLSVNLFELFGGHKQFQFPRLEELPFTHLTHLDVFSAMPKELWPFFGMLTSLTHLSFSDYYHRELFQIVLDTCAVLELLLVVWTQDEDPADRSEDVSTEITDPRFFTIWCEDFESDWERGAWGDLDFWRRADLKLAARRTRGEGSLPQN